MTTRRGGQIAFGTLPQLTNRERLIIAAVLQAAGELAAASRPTVAPFRTTGVVPDVESVSAVERFRGPPYLLTSREIDVLGAMARALSNKQIGQELGVSERTVETHRRHLLEKLGARNAAEVMMLVWRPAAQSVGH